MSIGKVEIIKGGQTATEDVQKKKGFSEIARPKLVVVKSSFKSLTNSREGAYFL